MTGKRLALAMVAVCGVLLIAWLRMGSQPGAALAHLTVPDGFEIELAAGPPLVERPMIVDMDEQGRLYVAESSGSNDPVKQQLEEKPHSILMLEDSNGDGRFDKRTVFAAGMMLPEGVMWLDGSLYVAAPPSIWKLTDTTGDGAADRREEWFDGKTLTNCANDLHGPYFGPDGWIYWCKGAFAEQTYERPSGKPFVTRSAHIFRRRPEGGPVEPVLTGGMDNPVEVVFTPEGERMLSATFIEHPQLGRRDGLLHAVYGGVYGKVHGVTDDHPQTGGYLSPMTRDMGPAVPVGLAYYESGALGEEFRGHLFATLFNLHKVNLFRLIPKGATFEAVQSDFLVSSSLDFHPTDVMEDADGSLLVVDTGAWYKLCCPTSQLSKPDVLGAIYRIRRKDAHRIEDPRGLKLDWGALGTSGLAALLGDARPVVRKRATQELARNGSEALPALTGVISEGSSPEIRRNAVWAATRIPDAAARDVVRRALSDPADTVRHAAIHSVSVWRDRQALAPLVKKLGAAAPPLQRAAAEALGRIGASAAVEPLLAATSQTNDEILLHSLTYALIEIADPAATRRGLSAASPRTRRAALIALDQMPDGDLRPETVIPLLSSSEPLLRETASWIAGQHPEWGGQLAGFFRGRLAAAKDAGEQEELERQLSRFTGDAAIQGLLAEAARSSQPSAQRIALRVIAKAPLRQAPAVWTAAVTAALRTPDAGLLREAVTAARALPAPEEGSPPDTHEGLHAELLRVGRSAKAPADVRAAALSTGAGALRTVEPELFSFLISHIGPDQPVPVRGAASRALAAAPLTDEQRLALADALKSAGPMELPTLIAAFEQGGGEALGERLLSALKESRAAANLPPSLLEAVLQEFPESIRERGEALLASLHIDRAGQEKHLDELSASLGEGDVRRGQELFNSSKTACSSCHKIGYLGGTVGPDLTRIGEIRSERDLLEAVVYPSASFVRSYEPVVVVTQEDVYSGVTVEETDDYVVLATGADTQARISRNAIEEMRPGTVSVMPSGLDEELTRRELADLIAFLKATRRGP